MVTRWRLPHRIEGGLYRPESSSAALLPLLALTYRIT
jgi:hypothetical protein